MASRGQTYATADATSAKSMDFHGKYFHPITRLVLLCDTRSSGGLRGIYVPVPVNYGQSLHGDYVLQDGCGPRPAQQAYRGCIRYSHGLE
jgi:hypothetical protein